jgi:hypothetical protein
MRPIEPPQFSRQIRHFHGAKNTSRRFITLVSLDFDDFFSSGTEIFIGSGKKLSPPINRLYIKGETASAINMKAVPSFSIFQEISEFMISGSELCPNAPLIPPVTILTLFVRDNLRRTENHVAKLSHQLVLNNSSFGQYTMDR